MFVVFQTFSRILQMFVHHNEEFSYKKGKFSLLEEKWLASGTFTSIERLLWSAFGGDCIFCEDEIYHPHIWKGQNISIFPSENWLKCTTKNLYAFVGPNTKRFVPMSWEPATRTKHIILRTTYTARKFD